MLRLSWFIVIFILPLLTFGQTRSTLNYWDSTKTYVYNAIYSDSAGNTITSETIQIKPTGKPWEFEPKQTLFKIKFDFNAKDSALLAANPLNGMHKPWKRNYLEGVIQDSTRVWMHPIRKNQYVLTELAPFPEVKLPIQRGDSWTNTLWIYKAFGTFEGTVESIYKIDTLIQTVYLKDTLNCWRINAAGTHNQLGKNSITYLYQEQLGFVELDYHFYNEQRLIFRLTNIKK